MLHSGKDSQPDEDSYDLVIGLLLQHSPIDTALKYIDLALKSGYMLSKMLFVECVYRCIREKRLESLVMVIEKCKVLF